MKPPLKGEIPREGTRRVAVGACFLWDREAVERSHRCAAETGNFGGDDLSVIRLTPDASSPFRGAN